MTNNELVREYHRRRAGKPAHFFDRDTMRFFGSKLGPCMWRGERAYFVTSEQPPHGRRAYSARVMDRDGDIQTIGRFCEYSKYKALKLAEQAAQLGLSAEEIGNGNCAVNEIERAKTFWEQAGGTLTEECERCRRNADGWAIRAGWTLYWDSIMPDVSRAADGRRYLLAQLVPFLDCKAEVQP